MKMKVRKKVKCGYASTSTLAGYAVSSISMGAAHSRLICAAIADGRYAFTVSSATIGVLELPIQKYLLEMCNLIDSFSFI